LDGRGDPWIAFTELFQFSDNPLDIRDLVDDRFKISRRETRSLQQRQALGSFFRVFHDTLLLVGWSIAARRARLLCTYNRKPNHTSDKLPRASAKLNRIILDLGAKSRRRSTV
jgi:hypothetical protein